MRQWCRRVGLMSDTALLVLISSVGSLGAWGGISILDNKSSETNLEALAKMWWGVGTFLVSLGVFGYSWWWAFTNWGWLLGIAFGWIPALIVAALAGALWPLVVSLGPWFVMYLGRQ